jgi:long-chain acyl-CoA synthetase
MATLLRWLDEHGERSPEHLACVVGAEQRTYGELAGDVGRCASGLRDIGLQPGDRISLYLPNSVAYVVCLYGAMRAGLVASPINSTFTPSEVAYLLADSEASAIVTTPELAARLSGVLPEAGLRAMVIAGAGAAPEAGTGAPTYDLSEMLAVPARDLAYPDDDWPACLPYSSGTTGRSKGIVHSHDSLAMQAILSANHLQLRPEDVLVQALPLVHLYPGNIIMGGLITAGATMVVQAQFDPPTFVELLGRVRATSCAGVPTTYAMLCRLPADAAAGTDLTALQVAFSAGAPLATDIRTEFLRRFGARVLDCYGITEAAGNLTATMRYGETPERSCGVPYPMTDVRIVDPDDNDVAVGDVGELIARGPQIMTSYWRRPEATSRTLRGGWLHTGDLARRDQRGFVYIVDRKNDMIIVGGYNVYPAEIEEVLQGHPDVALCAVFAVPDAIKGEKPWAAVVPHHGAAVDGAALDAHCRERLAPYKIPRRFVIVDDLPRSPVGKILRRELRRQFAEAPGGPEPTPVTSTPPQAPPVAAEVPLAAPTAPAVPAQPVPPATSAHTAPEE